MEGKNLGKMMENNRNGDVGGFVFAGILTIISLFIIAIALFTSGLSWDLLFLSPLIVIIFIPWYFTIKGHKNNSSIEKHIKDGTVIIKKATIKEIKEHRGDGFQDHYLIIVATDGSSTFKRRITVWDRQSFSGCAVGDVVNVYVDPNDSKNYLMDV